MRPDFEKRAKRARKIRETRGIEQVDSYNYIPQLTFTPTELSRVLPCKSERQLRRLINDIEAEGHRTFSRKKNRQFALSLEDVYWLRDWYKVPTYAKKEREAFVINIANLKGGVGKSTCSGMLAQGLTYYTDFVLEERRILVMDLDPQSSATKQLLGVFLGNSEEFMSCMTLMASTDNTAESIKKHSIKKTVWGNIDIIPATTEDAFMADQLPGVAEELNLPAYELLQRHVIDKVKHEYDFIIIDAGPHLDNVMRNCLVASDGVFIPVPPTSYDFDSTLKFIERLPEEIDSLQEQGYSLKMLFMDAFLNMEELESGNEIGRHYNDKALHELNQVFGYENVIQSGLCKEIPYQRCSEEGHTVFTISKSDYVKNIGSADSYQRAKDGAVKWLKAVANRVESCFEGGE